MTQLRHLSQRPTLLVDERNRKVQDPPSKSLVGRPNPLGRSRIVFAIPMGPLQIITPQVVHDHDGCFIADPDGNLIGKDKVVVHRMLTARWTLDTRRLAG